MMKQNYTLVNNRVKQTKGFPLWLAILLTTFLFFSTIPDVDASHYRYGSISWQTTTTPNTVQFKVAQGWRLSAYGVSGLGSQVYTGSLLFGDGSSGQIYLTVTSINAAEDWFFGEATITHTYPTTGNFTAYYSSCCRIGGMQNNSSYPGYYFRSETIVNVGSGNSSPVATIAPIINLQNGQNPATFQLAATDPDGDHLSYRLATSAETGGGSNPPGLSISSSGLVSFNTVSKVVGHLYSAIVVVEDGQSKTMADFIIRIVQTSTPPVFDYSVTPTNGFTYQVSPGQNVSFALKATDSDPGSSVTLSAVGIPLGASFSPALPAGPANPVQTSFSWTPSNSALGTSVINFTAQDNNGVQSSTSVNIIVSLKPQFDVPPTPALGDHQFYTPGQLITYTIQASDPDINDVVTINLVQGKAMNGSPIALYSGASFSPLPTATANPTSGTFSWQTTAADWGHRHLFFTAEDSYGDKTVHEISQLLNTTPVFNSSPVTTINVGQVYTYNIIVADPDILYGDALTLFATTLPSWLTFTDNGNGSATLTGTPLLSDVGSHSVLLEAQDINHHYSVSGIPQQNFSITVNPCMLSITESHVNETCNAANGSIELTVTGANNPATFMWTGPNGFSSTSEDLLGLVSGTYNVTVTDAYNCTESLQVTIANDPDVTPPSVYTKDITVHLSTFGYASIGAGDVNNGSDDNCGIASMSVSPSNFSCAEYGLNTVTLTVLDNNGNSASETAVVNVIYPSTQVGFNANNYINNGYSSYLGNGEYRLTTASYYQFGSVWYQNQLDLTQDFDLEFDIFLGYNNGGADGMAFVLQPLSTGQGGNGGGLGYMGITPSLVVEFDTWQNYADPAADHVALTRNGDIYHHTSNTIAGPVTVSNLENGQYHSVKITWTAQSTNLKVVLDGSQLINYTDNVVSSIFGGNSGVYWGFTGATGGAYNDQRVKIKNVSFVEQLNVSQVNITPSECADSEDGSIDIAVVPFNPCYSYLWSNGATTEDISNVNAGQYTVTIYHPDGSSITETYTVPIGDNTPPTIIAQNATLQLDANGGVNLSLGDVVVSVSDNCAIASTVVSQTTFDCSHVGPNAVSITSTDVNNNTTTENVTVTVEDNVLPIAIAQNITIQLDASGNASILSGDIDDGSSDACGIASYALSQYAFDCSHVGANTVILSVTDNNGNLSSATSIVTVEDNVAAIAIAMDITVQLDASGNANIIASDVNNGSNDACGILSMSVLPGSFNCSNVGLNIVTLTVVDVNNNVSSASSFVTVEDNVAPIALTKNITIYLDANGVAGIVASDVNDGSNDACGIASMSVLPNSFDCTNTGTNTVTLTVTDNNGNVSTETAVVTVEDNTAPTLSCVADLDRCANIPFVNTYMTDGTEFDLTAMWDNCSIVSVTNDQNSLSSLAGHVFVTGNTLVTWTVVDASGNTTTCSFTVTVNPLPVASIASTGANEWCNGVTLTANSSTTEGSYAWSTSEITQDIVLSLNTSTAGNYTVFVTDQNGCTSPLAASYTYDPQSLASSYTIIGSKEVKLGERDEVQSGSVGVTSVKGHVKLGKYTRIDGSGSFVKADKISKHNTSIATTISDPAVITLPAMNYYNPASGNYSNVKVKKNTTQTISTNHVSVKVEEGATAILQGTVFGHIEVEKGGTVVFTSALIDIEELKVHSHGKKHGAYAFVSFSGDAVVRVKKKVEIEGKAMVNSDGHQVIFYIGYIHQSKGKSHHHHGELKIKKSYSSVYFTASAYVPGGEIEVQGSHKKSETTYMTGFFIAEKIKSNGKYVIWNWHDCYQNSSSGSPRIAEEPTFIEEEGKMSLKAYPNPFNGVANIEFTVPVSGKAKVDVYNMVGMHIATLFDGDVEEGNSYTEVFQAGELSKGVYLIRLTTDTESLVERIILAD